MKESLPWFFGNAYMIESYIPNNYHIYRSNKTNREFKLKHKNSARMAYENVASVLQRIKI